MTKRTKTASGLSIFGIDILIRFGLTPVECHVWNDHKIHNLKSVSTFMTYLLDVSKTKDKEEGQSFLYLSRNKWQLKEQFPDM